MAESTASEHLIKFVSISPDISKLVDSFTINVDYSVDDDVSHAFWTFELIFDFTHEKVRVQLGTTPMDNSSEAGTMSSVAFTVPIMELGGIRCGALRDMALLSVNLKQYGDDKIEHLLAESKLMVSMIETSGAVYKAFHQ